MDAVAAQPGKVTVLALAALTNIALAVRLDPNFAANLGSLVVLGGAYNVMGNVDPVAEANIWHDPEAADFALGSFPDGVVKLIGLDVTQLCMMPGSQLDALKVSGGRFAEYVWSISQFYKAYHMTSNRLDGIFLHDPTAFVAVFRPELFSWTPASVCVALEGCARARTILDLGTKKCAPTRRLPRARLTRSDAAGTTSTRGRGGRSAWLR